MGVSKIIDVPLADIFEVNNVSSGNIAKVNDVEFADADTEAPTVPTSLIVTPTCQTTADLSWNASTDNIGIAGYKIYRNATLFHTTVGTGVTYNATGLTANTSYTWTVSAYDAAGNESSQSTGVARTQPPTVIAVTMTAFGNATATGACNDLTTTTRYTQGGALSASAIVYTSTCANVIFNGNNQYFSDGVNSFQVSNTGVVSNVAFCF